MENSVLPPLLPGRTLAPIPAPAALISSHAAAWGELQVLQQKGQKGSLAGGLTLLVVSLVLFAGVGTAQWTWQRCALIIGILFVHELGHYAAMRWFKYRELRMFFIPLFGAAVTGRHFNVPGWKKAIVSLMGPLPGILIGSGLAVAGIITANDMLMEAATLTIFINLFNLLPILPLDGGWFWNALFFCRHRWLEAAFQVTAGLVCLAASTRGLGMIWLYLGLVMVLKVPGTLRLGAIASRLRRESWKPGGDDFVTEEMAERLFQELESKTPKKTAKPKDVATEALTVFEKMNASPPNWLESVGLSALYGVALVVALGALGFATLYTRGVNQAHNTPAPAAPKHEPVLHSQFDGKIMRVAAAKPVRDNERQEFFYATYPDASATEAHFRELQSSLEARDTLLRFGQTLVASTIAKPSNKAHAHQLREKLRQSGNLISTGDRYTWAQCDLAFTVADEAAAQRLYRQLDLTFRLPFGFQPPAPWEQTSAPQASEAMLKAQATYLRVVDVHSAVMKDAALSRMQRRNAVTAMFTRRNYAADWEKFAAKRQRLEREAIERLQESNDPTLDQEVLAMMLRQPRPAMTNIDQTEIWEAELRRKLTGDAEPAATAVDEDGEVYAMGVGGSVTLEGNRVTLTGLNFQHADRSFADLATWLSNSGFTDVRYGFYNGAVQSPSQPALASK
jgi:Zn-dependent protease